VPLGQAMKGYALVLAAATLWGSIGIFYREIIGYGLSTMSAVLARGIIACIILLVSLGIWRRDLLCIHIRDIPYFAVMGFITVTLVFSFYANAIMLVGVSVAAVLQYTAPAFVTLIAWQVYGEPLARPKIVALGLCMAGVVLIARLYDSSGVQLNLVGLLYGLASGITFGLYSILNKRAVKLYSAWTVTTYNLTFGTLFLVLIQAPSLANLLAAPSAVWPLVIAMAIGPTVLAHGLYVNGLTRVPASNASIVATWEPATATILAFAILGERLDGLQLLGAAAIITGVILLSRKGA